MSAIQAADEPGQAALRTGVLVGFGLIAKGHIEGYRRLGRMGIGAVVDITMERRHAAETELGLPTYASLQAALAAASFDFVDICSPPSSHLDLMAEGVAHGLPVLCEKPLLASAEDIPQLLDLVAQAPAAVHPCHNYLHAPGLMALRHALVGLDAPVNHIRMRTERVGHAQGVPDWMPDWRRRRDIAGGGLLCDHGPHSIYLACALAGRSLLGVSCSIEHPDVGGWRDTEDRVEMILHFGPVDVEVELTWRAPARATVYEVFAPGVELVLKDDLLQVNRDGGFTTTTIIPSAFDDPCHGAWFADVFREIETRLDAAQTNPHLGHALMTMLGIEAAYDSARSGGRRVDLAPLPSPMVARSRFEAFPS